MHTQALNKYLSGAIFMAILTAVNPIFADVDTVNRQAVSSLKAYAAYKAGNYEEARIIWLKLAEAGNTTAMNNLANMFDQGQGVDEDSTAAIVWLRKAAKSGDPIAQLNLGLAYETGRGVKKDNHEAANWFLLAAKQGDVDAQFNLGVMLATAHGKGVSNSTPEQRKQAIKWLTKANEQRHAEAGAFLKLLEN